MDEVKAERDKRADKMERQLVNFFRDQGYTAERIDGKVDVQCCGDGEIKVIDCKFSDDIVFWLEKSDIDKGLNYAKKLQADLGNRVPVKFYIDMWFIGRKGENRRIFRVLEKHRGAGIRIIKTKEGIEMRTADKSRQGITIQELRNMAEER